MTNRIKEIKLAFLLAVSAFFVNPHTMTAKNSFETPDFAYPQTVADNARVAMESATKRGDYMNMIKAAIQLSIAHNEISESSLQENYQMMDSLAQRAPAPYSNLLRVLQGEMMSQMYMSDIWRYNQRQLPLTDIPEDPKEWSRDIFALRILELSHEAMKDEETLKRTPLSSIEPLLNKETTKYIVLSPTLYDFVGYKVTYLLANFCDNSERQIPFLGGGRKSVSEECVRYRDEIMQSIERFHVDDKDLIPWAYAFVNIQKFSWDATFEKYRQGLSKCADSPASLIILESMYGCLGENKRSNPEFMEWYQVAKEALRRFPLGIYAGNVSNQLNNATLENVSVYISTQYLSTDTIKALVELNNCKKINLLLYQIPFSLDNLTRDNIIAKGSRKVALTVETDSVVPFTKEMEVNIPNLGYGRYVLVSSKGKELSMADSKYPSSSVFVVSDLSVVCSTDEHAIANTRMYIVDGHTQQPVSGAKVTMSTRYGNKKENKSYKSNSEGWVPCPEGNFDVDITKGNDHLLINNYAYEYERNDEDRYNVELLTDLALYHPGDTIGFAAVLTRLQGKKISLVKEGKIGFRLFNANYQVVDSVTLVTDEYGRATGKLRIPDTGVLGTYEIESTYDENTIEETAIEVAEYVAPTFFVEIEESDAEYKVGDKVKFKGHVTTYSGMPVADAKVHYTIKYRNFFWWWFGGGNTAEYGDDVTTDKEGNFEVELDTKALAGTRYALGRYTIVAEATNGAGETQSSEGVSFCLGRGYDISLPNDQVYLVSGKEVKLPATVTNIMGNTVTKQVDYKIFKGDEESPLMEGSFESPELVLPAESLPSGEYKLEAKVPDNGEDAYAQSCKFIVYRPDDKHPPVATPLWVPQERYIARDGEKDVEVKFGSSYSNSWILMEISDSNGFLSREWVKVDAANKKIKVKAPGENDKLYIAFAGMHDLNGRIGKITIVPEGLTKKMNVEAVSFRDKITPGDKEKWSFRFTIDGYTPGVIPSMAVMSNKALNAITPFTWSFAPRNYLHWGTPTRVGYNDLPHTISNYWQADKKRNGNTDYLSIAEFDLYGRSLYGYHRFRSMGYKERSYLGAAAPEPMRAMKNSVGSDDMIMADMAVEEETVASSAPMEAKGAAAEDENTPLREIECPVAFFYPSLISDANGVVDIEFEVPNFNTTWQLQVLGYNAELWSACTKMESVASKKVMVQTNAPRFLRSGDHAILRATIMNNTDEEAKVDGRIRLFNPLTDETLIDYSSGEKMLPAKGSAVIEVEYDVPADMQFVGIASYAYGDGHTDGEQTLISILPSSTPVIESEQFYLGRDEQSAKVALPTYPGDASVTLTYCNNPIWLCITALTDIRGEESESIIWKISSLYANAVAAGVVAKYPQASEAIEYWRTHDDGTLTSNLQKNENLKLMALDQTIWVRNAAGETLRMSKLAELLEPERSAKAISDLIGELQERQNFDGSWSWCSGMKGSEFITCGVLDIFATLKRIDMYPDDPRLKDMAIKAIKYLDAESYKDYKRAENQFSITWMLRYLSARSWFKVTPTAEFATLQKKALAAISKEWKDMTIAQCASAAILLNREGYPTESRNILESLRQRAISKPGKGTWYDNLRNSWTPMSKLLTTAEVLEAFEMLAPEDKMVDGLRQWLILQKETQEWGRSNAASEVVAAILSGGAKWTDSAEMPTFRLNGRELTLPEINEYTGEFVMPLDPKECRGGMLEVNRPGTNPAWGGVIAQYVLPIEDVKPHSTDDLSIKKKVYKVTTTADGVEVTDSKDLKVGDKVRITLTIVNPRDLQYVAVADNRSAALSPIEQLSKYTTTDGVWYYQEVRNAVTNLFIEYLPKGTHVITYDCFVTQEGEYSLGIANAQSLYAPSITANSEGGVIR